MTSSCYSDELLHYGVKGMKWGVRKDRIKSTASKKTKQVKTKIKESVKTHKQVRSEKKERRAASKRRFILSDEDLDNRIDRLSREKKLRELTESEISYGRAFVKKNAKKNTEIAIEGQVRKVSKMPKKK